MSPARLELPGEHPLAGAVRDFLADLAFSGKSPNTIRAYRGDLAELAQHHAGDVAQVDATVLRSYFAAIADLAASTRARKQASLAAFLRWAVRQDLIGASPMDRLERVTVPEGAPRPVEPARIDKVFAVIPRPNLRDRLLFEFLKHTGTRVSEALGVHVEDLVLQPGDERVVIHGKGGRVRTLLLDEPRLVNLLRRFLRTTGYTHGPLFRAAKNWVGGGLRYSTAQELWARYRAVAGEPGLELHQLRHTHATELTKDNVSARTIQKRLGHRKLQTTLVYAEHSDAQADAELRARQRRTAGRPAGTTTTPVHHRRPPTAGAPDNRANASHHAPPPGPRPMPAPPRSTACPTCRYRPTSKHELQLHREGLETVWLVPDHERPGLVVERWHREQCQPHRADVVMCPCGSSVMLSDDLVGQPGEVPVIAALWLRDHGWTRNGSSWRCHQHAAPEPPS